METVEKVRWGVGYGVGVGGIEKGKRGNSDAMPRKEGADTVAKGLVKKHRKGSVS